MSLESDVGRVTRDVMGAVADSVCFNLTSLLKSDMKLSDEQILRANAIVRSTIESSGFNGVNQYVSLFNTVQKESEGPKKGKLFG